MLADGSAFLLSPCIGNKHFLKLVRREKKLKLIFRFLVTSILKNLSATATCSWFLYLYQGYLAAPLCLLHLFACNIPRTWRVLYLDT